MSHPLGEKLGGQMQSARQQTNDKTKTANEIRRTCRRPAAPDTEKRQYQRYDADSGNTGRLCGKPQASRIRARRVLLDGGRSGYRPCVLGAFGLPAEQRHPVRF
ncbi:MAG: hypothetical protein ACLVEJ_16815 [Parabacteroides sp.]